MSSPPSMSLDASGPRTTDSVGLLGEQQKQIPGLGNRSWPERCRAGVQLPGRIGSLLLRRSEGSCRSLVVEYRDTPSMGSVCARLEFARFDQRNAVSTSNPADRHEPFRELTTHDLAQVILECGSRRGSTERVGVSRVPSQLDLRK